MMQLLFLPSFIHNSLNWKEKLGENVFFKLKTKMIEKLNRVKLALLID
jgi:hypothetical protein